MRVRPSEHERVGDPAEGAERRADHERQEPDAVGAEPEDGGALLVLAHGRHRMARPGPHEHGDRDPRHDDEAERQPVAVGRVGHAHEQIGHCGAVERSPLLAPVTPPGLRMTMIDAACAKARVTIAKAIPPTRSAIAPTTRASTVDRPRAASTATGRGSAQVESEIVSR